MELSDEQWRRRLTKEQYRVLREAGTDPAFSGKYVNHHEDGVYSCAACQAMLFKSDHKFDSRSGWPSFYDVAATNAVTLRDDLSGGMHRTEILCASCGSHLGHVFDDTPSQPTGMRYCVNSTALAFDGGRGVKS